MASYGRKRHFLRTAFKRVVRRLIGESRKRQWKTQRVKVIEVGKIGAVVIPLKRGLGPGSFMIKVGRVKPRSYPPEVEDRLFPEDLLDLPQLTCAVARYLSDQALRDEEVRSALGNLVSDFVEAKSNGTYPRIVTQLSRYVTEVLSKDDGYWILSNIRRAKE